MGIYVDHVHATVAINTPYVNIGCQETGNRELPV